MPKRDYEKAATLAGPEAWSKMSVAEQRKAAEEAAFTYSYRNYVNNDKHSYKIPSTKSSTSTKNTKSTSKKSEPKRTYMPSSMYNRLTPSQQKKYYTINPASNKRVEESNSSSSSNNQQYRNRAFEARDVLIKGLGKSNFNSLSKNDRVALIKSYAENKTDKKALLSNAKSKLPNVSSTKKDIVSDAASTRANSSEIYNGGYLPVVDVVGKRKTQTNGATQPLNKGNNGGQPANKDVKSPVEKGGNKPPKYTIKDTPARTAEQVKKDNTPMTHTIRKGETLGEIANKYGVSVKELAANNGIDNPDLIIAGKTLQIGKTNAGKPVPVKPKKKPRRANRNVEQRVIPNITKAELLNTINAQVPTAEDYDSGYLGSPFYGYQSGY